MGLWAEQEFFLCFLLELISEIFSVVCKGLLLNFQKCISLSIGQDWFDVINSIKLI